MFVIQVTYEKVKIVGLIQIVTKSKIISYC